MEVCGLCADQAKIARNGKPHENLLKIDAPRIFKGAKSRGYEEQDYQCQECKSRFTYSSDKNDLSWTLWRG